MALDKVVDSSKLDGAMLCMADTIRRKTNRTEKIVWDENKGFTQAIENIVGISLQEKTVEPTGERQIVRPDEGIEGLSSVTVEPIPFAKLVGTEVTWEIQNGFSSDKISFDTEINEVFPNYFLYNDVRLREIPTEVLTQYPNCLIRHDVTNGIYYLLASAAKKYFYNSKNKTLDSDYQLFYRYKIDAAVSEAQNLQVWDTNGYTTESFDLDSSSVLVWSNYNVMKDAVDGETVYFAATEPVPV